MQRWMRKGSVLGLGVLVLAGVSLAAENLPSRTRPPSSSIHANTRAPRLNARLETTIPERQAARYEDIPVVGMDGKSTRLSARQRTCVFLSSWRAAALLKAIPSDAKNVVLVVVLPRLSPEEEMAQIRLAEHQEGKSFPVYRLLNESPWRYIEGVPQVVFFAQGHLRETSYLPSSNSLAWQSKEAHT